MSKGAQAQFLPSLVLGDFALLDKYYTPTLVADAVAYRGIVQATEASVDIGRFLRALRPLQPCCQRILSCKPAVSLEHEINDTTRDDCCDSAD